MKHCRKWEEQIALFALGELGAAEADELRRHIESCPPCRVLYEELLAEERRIASAFEAIDATEKNRPEELSVNFAVREASLGPKGTIGGRRPDAGSPFRAIRRIAAAIVIAGGVIGLALGLLKLGSATPAFAEIAGPILKSTTCTFNVTTEIAGANEPAVAHAMFVAAGRMRMECEGDYVAIVDFEQSKMITLLEGPKIAIVATLENMPAAKIDEIRHASLFGVREAIEQAGDSAQYLGERQMEGRTVVGYRIEEEMTETRIWADVGTFLPVRIETSINSSLGVGVRCVMSDFVFDAELDESLFSMEVPEGYQSDTMEVDASVPQEREFLELLRMYADNNAGSFPESLSPDAFIQGAMAGRISPPHELTEEQKGRLRRELDSLVADAKANLLQLQAIIEGDEPPAGLDSLAENIDLNLKALSEYEEKKSSLEEEVRKATDEWLDSVDDNILTVMRNTYKEVAPAARGLLFLSMLPADSDWRYAGQGVTLGESSVPIFSYKPKNSDKYRVIYADLAVIEVAPHDLPYMPEQKTAASAAADEFRDDGILSEDAFVLSMRIFTDFCDGNFPDSIGLCKTSDDLREYQSQKLRKDGKIPFDPQLKLLRDRMLKIVNKISDSEDFYHGLLFAYCLNAENEPCYAGRGATTDDVDTPIFWYKPHRYRFYRVMYADLTVESVSAENLPQAPEGSETYEDLHANHPEPEPQLPSDANAVAILQQVQARYNSMQTYRALVTSATDHTSTSVVDVNALRTMLPEHRHDIVDLKEFSDALTRELSWQYNFKMTLSRPDGLLIEEISNTGTPDAAWYEDGKYHTLENGREKSSDRLRCGMLGDETIPDLFYKHIESLKDLELEGAVLLDEEVIDRQQCYVISGRKYTREIRLWITKDTHLILKTVEIAKYELNPPSQDKRALQKSISETERYDGVTYIQRLAGIARDKLAHKQFINSETTITYTDIGVNEPVSPQELIPTAYRERLPSGPNPVAILHKVREKYVSLDTLVSKVLVETDFVRTRFDDVNNLPGIPRQTAAQLLENEEFRKLLVSKIRSRRDVTLRLSRPYYCIEWVINRQNPAAAWSDGEGHHTLINNEHIINEHYYCGQELWSFGRTIPTIFYDYYYYFLSDIDSPRMLPDESFDGDSCYCIEGLHSGRKTKLWISRETMLIRKLEIHYQYEDRRKLELTKDDLGKLLSLLGKGATDENRQWLGRLIDAGFLAKGHASGVTVETHSDIVLNKPIPDAHLIPEIAAQLVGQAPNR